MPWKVVKRKGARPWKIIRSDTGEVVGSSTSKAMAMRSLAYREGSTKRKSEKRTKK